MVKQRLFPKERASLNPECWSLIPYPNACQSVVVDRKSPPRFENEYIDDKP